MYRPLLLLVVVLQVAAAAHVLPIHYTPSLKMKLYQEGTLKEYLARVELRKTSSQLQQGSTPVIDYEDMAYMVQITLGTPAQTFVTFLDSGSANLWVPDVSCSQGQDSTCGSYCAKTPYATCITFCDNKCCTNTAEKQLAAANSCASKHRFNSTLSTTYQKQTGTFSITYNSGQVDGIQGVDTFCLFNSTFCVTNQGFGQATSIGADFAKQPEDGIIGLGWPALAINQITPPMFNAYNQGLLDQPYYVIYMSGIGPTSTLNGGTMTVGALDTTNCGDVTYIPLTSQTYWQFKMNGVTAGAYTSTPTSGWQAISDTASTLIGGPTAIVQNIAKAVGAKYYPEFESFFIDCEAAGPDVVFSINNSQYRIRAKNYVVSVGAGPCLFAFFTQDAGGFYPQWMLGPPLIREYCQVYDVKSARVGMAKVLNS